MWEVILLDEVDRWFIELAATDREAAEAVTGAIDLLEAEGPSLGRPAVDRVKGWTRHSLKELRPPSSSAEFCSSSIRSARQCCWWRGTRRARGSSGIATTSQSRSGVTRIGSTVNGREVSEMARSWRAVRDAAVSQGLVDEQRARNARKELQEAVRAQRLADLRKGSGSTQVQVAEAIGVTQGYVSRLERGDLAHTEMGTLESYVEALGGKLRVTVEMGDATFTLHE